MSAIKIGFGSELSISLLDRRIAVTVEQFNVQPSGDGLNGSLGIKIAPAAPDVHLLPDVDLGMALEVHVGGENHVVRVNSIKLHVTPTATTGTLGIRPETDADLQGNLPLGDDPGE